MPVRILAYTALLWLDLIRDGIVTKKEGFPPVFPVVVHSGAEKWKAPLSIQELLSPEAELLAKYQPNNLVLLVEEKTFTDEVLNKKSDFYAMFLSLKRSKTPMAMIDVIMKYKDELADPARRELLKTILAILEMLYKCFTRDATASNIYFTSLEEAITAMKNFAIDWKKNMQEEVHKKLLEQGRDKGIKDGKILGKLEVAKAMLLEGLSLELIVRITKLPLAEIKKLQEQGA